jgi:hypothetical protein
VFKFGFALRTDENPLGHVSPQPVTAKTLERTLRIYATVPVKMDYAIGALM